MQPEPDITDRRSRRDDADDPREAEAPGTQDLPACIVNAAIAIGEERGRWSAVRLHDVAGRLGVPTSQVLDHFPDLDSVADAWFMRALKAMVGQKPPEFLELPEWRRIELCFNAWFDALAPHRRMTAQMLRGKLHLPHLHHWVPMIFNLSRTIQWLREAAQLSGKRRALQGTLRCRDRVCSSKAPLRIVRQNHRPRRATVKIGLANLTYNMRRLVWIRTAEPTRLSVSQRQLLP